MKKTCTQCKERKPSSAYHKDSRKADGLSSACRLCRNASKRAAHKSKLPTQPEKKKNAIDANSELNFTKVFTLEDVGQKYGVAVNIVRDKNGHYTLGIHSRPIQITVHGESEQEVIDLAMSQG